MTDRARLTVEVLAEMNRHIEALEAMGTKAFFSLEPARKDRAEFLSALSDLRRESAAPEGGLSKQLAALAMLNAHFSSKDGRPVDAATISRQDYAQLFRALMEVDMALRSLERPAGRVVPEEATMEMYRATDGHCDAYGYNHKTQMPCLTYETIAELWKAMLAASPPAATEGWVSKRDEVVELLDSLQACASSVVDVHGLSFKNSLSIDLNAAIRNARAFLAKHPSGGEK